MTMKTSSFTMDMERLGRLMNGLDKAHTSTGEEHPHDERMGPSTGTPFRGVGGVTTSSPVSPLGRHAEGRRSRRLTYRTTHRRGRRI